MDRRLWACMAMVTTAAVSMAGCQSRSAQPTFDPFVNRATIPPPPTGAAAGGTAPPFSPPVVTPGAGGAYPPSSTPQIPYGPPPAYSPSPSAGQYTPPPIQPPTTTPYAPPGGYQYRQGAANEWPETAPVEERTGRRMIAARGQYNEIETVAYTEEVAPASETASTSSQVRFAGGGEMPNRPMQAGNTRAVGYERAADERNSKVSTLRFVNSEPARPIRPVGPSSVVPTQEPALVRTQEPALVRVEEPALEAVQEPVEAFVPQSRFEDHDSRRSQPIETVAMNRQPAQPQVGQTHSIVSKRTSDVALTAPANFAAEETTPAQVETTTASQSTARFAHDAQYQWLNGRLEYSQLDRRWKLRYIEIDGETDSFGGSVILSDASQLQGFQPGEFVTVRGSVDNSPRAAGSFAPNYRLVQIERGGN